MKILYLSCHSILEHDEVKLFTEMGHEVFSFGSYQNPQAPHDPKRPSIDGKPNDQLLSVAIQSSQENLHPEMIAWADVIIVMHRVDWVVSNWEKIKHKKVILRTIGQNVPDTENQLIIPRSQGLKVVRYSPGERNIGGYAGEDAMIRFYKDPLEYCGYIGDKPMLITMAQSMRQREPFCGYGIFKEVSNGYASAVFGPGNEETGYPGGLLSYSELKEAYRRNRVYFYTGTYPASYTLNFIEAFMTGIPIVAIGRGLATLNLYKDTDTYEVDKFIQNGINGYISDSIEDLRQYAGFLLENPTRARKIGEKGREKAIELFGKETIKAEWESFLNSL